MLKAKIQETDAHAVRAQDSQDHAFTVERRASTHAEVNLIDDRLTVLIDRFAHLIKLWNRELDATVLRNATLGDVHACQQLDGGKDCILQILRQLLNLHAHTVDAVAEHDVPLRRFDMNV